jgi:hypothetical protein
MHLHTECLKHTGVLCTRYTDWRHYPRTLWPCGTPSTRGCQT